MDHVGRSRGAALAALAVAWLGGVAWAQAPATPGSLVATPEPHGKVRLSWGGAGANVSWYELEREPSFATRRRCRAGSTVTVDAPPVPGNRYRVRAIGPGGASAWSAWKSVFTEGVPEYAGYVRPALDGSGWTDFSRVPADARVIYVSASGGLDGNSGLSADAPKRTIAAGIALLRDGMPDRLLLKRGDVFGTGVQGWRLSGRSAHEPIVIGAYGSGPRPRLRTGEEAGFVHTHGPGSPVTRFLAIVGIHFDASGRKADSPAYGFAWFGPGEDVLLEDCRIEGYAQNMLIDPGAEGASRFAVRRCVVVDSYWSGGPSVGLYADATRDLLIEECVFDHNGFLEGFAEPTIYSHNIYLSASCRDPIIRSNIISEAASHGVQARLGGLISDNLLVRNPIAILAGGVDEFGVEGSSGTVVYANVVQAARDIDPGTPRGWGIECQWMVDGRVVDNVLSSPLVETGFSISLTAGEPGPIAHVEISGNIVHDWGSPMVFNGRPRDLLAVGVSHNQICDLGSRSSSLVEGYPCSLAPGQVRGWHNQYHTGQRPRRWFLAECTGTTDLPEFMALTADTTSVSRRPLYLDAGRTVEAYNASLGRPASFADFIARARAQSRANWDERFVAPVVNTWIRAGFLPGPCAGSADLDDGSGTGTADGGVGIEDLLFFLQNFEAGDPPADVDDGNASGVSDGGVGIEDLLFYLAAFESGCV